MTETAEQFTPEQIEAHCKPIENLADAAGWEDLPEEIGVLIIRQLQEEAKPAKSHNCEEFYTWPNIQ